MTAPDNQTRPARAARPVATTSHPPTVGNMTQATSRLSSSSRTPSGAINYRVGDATSPAVSGHKIIAHVCNDQGGWGAGFVLALSRRWSEPEERYRAWARSGDNFALAMVQIIPVQDQISVANLVAQHGYRSRANPVPLRYAALETCLHKLAHRAVALQASVHLPRIGTGLAGGSWDKVESLLDQTLIASGVETFVYDLPE